MLKSLIPTVLFAMAASLAYAEKTPEEVFSEIYSNKVWGTNTDGEGHSGGGSTLDATTVYRSYLEKVLSFYKVRSVIDVGCGDWEFSHAINWDGIDYIGIDVVKDVIERNREKYEKDNVHFIQGDILSADLPKADVLICKEVLQHLTNEDVSTFILQLSKFKFCIITNDVDPITLSSSNPQVSRGDFRFLDLTQPPFNVKGLKILHYKANGRTKQVLFIQPFKP